MPFKLKLKKSRQYNVTSKSLFVISVHHLLVLDTPTTVDCTLSSESTGQECLDNVCQRLSIQQLEFFGLRYVVKDTDELRWVDLERPLSRQLEKYAASPRLYLRVMYYVISGVSLINDEVARNYYFLQLKSDVVDGRISCDPKQAVILAIYCRQAQYDSHSSERHTVDYLKTLLPFPRHMIEAGLLETLTEEVLQPNADIQKLTQAAAEGLFIAACQQLDGYGQEKFVAKDDASAEVVLGITVSGVAVTSNVGAAAAASQATAMAPQEYLKFYPWHDISNVVNHKRTFNIECTIPENSVGFTLADADTGRYFWKLCVLQHTFYMKYEQHHKHLPEPMTTSSSSSSAAAAGKMTNIFANPPEEPYDSRDNLFLSDPGNLHAHAMYASDSHIAAASSATTPANGGYPIGTGQHWANDSAMSSTVSLSTSQQHLRALAVAAAAVNQHNSNWGLSGSASGGGLPMDGNHNNGNVNGSTASLHNHRAQSTSCLDLSNNNTSNNGGHAGSQERERLKALLPGYRPAPDYETAVHQKYANSETELRQQTPVAAIAAQTAAVLSDPYLNIYSGSQPDVHRATTVADAIFGKQLQQQYPDVTQTTNPGLYQQQLQQQQHHQQQIQQQLPLHIQLQQQQQQQQPPHLHHGHPYLQHLHGTSPSHQPGAPHQFANGNANASDAFTQQLNRFIKPPPPYAAHRLSSTSTPDLAVASHRAALYGYRGAYVSGSSPDLVSTRTFLNTQYMKQQQQMHHQLQTVPAASMLPSGGGGGGAAGGGAGSAAMRYRYSQSHIPHGTYENLNTFLESPQAKATMLTQQLHQAAAAAAAAAAAGPIAAYRHSTSQQHLAPAQQQQQHYGNNGSSNGNNNSTSKSQQMLTRNGSIEPIYENVPLPRNSGTPTATATAPANASSSEMRDRTSSIQSAPGVMRYNQKPPPIGGSMNVLNDPQALNFAGLSMHDETDKVKYVPEVLVHRSVSKTSSNPIYLTQHQQQQQERQQQQQQQQQQLLHPDHNTSNTPPFAVPTISSSTHSAHSMFNSSTSNLGTDLANPKAQPLPPSNGQQQHNNIIGGGSRSHSIGQLNASSSHGGSSGVSASMLATTPHDSGISSSYSTTAIMPSLSSGVPNRSVSLLAGNNSSLDTTASTDATNSSRSSSVGKEQKKKRRWAGFFGGSKSSLSSLDKQKSATLGRHKEKASKSSLAMEEESNLRHRWSTGLPRSPAGPEPVPVTMSKEKLCQILESKLSDPQLYVEFECIPKRKEHARYECALHDENRNRNMDPNFLPYDDNRVHLTPTRENRLGYVNASHVSATVGSKQRFYVVAQSPSADTLTTFLQCVWEADVYLLVQLSDEVSYVPAGSSKCLEYGQYQVWQEFSQVTDRCITSKLRLYHTASRRYRSVWHLNYADWAEQNCPRDVGHFLDFLEELNSVRLAAVNEVPPGHNSNPPVMIHCSEGGGRGGIALAADLLLYTLDHNQDLDIPRVVSQLRHQRDNIIPSLAQYKFMYALLIQYLKRTRLI